MFYRGSVLANLLPVEEATKAGSLSTLPSLKRSHGLSELSLLNLLEHKVPTRTTTSLVSLASITSELIAMKESREKKAIQAQELERNTSKSLSLITRALCGIWRGFDLLVCLELNARALVSSWEVENLDALNGGVVGVFIAPTTKLDRWWRLSVRWRTGHVTNAVGF